MTQSKAFEILKTGANVFLTGNAGSGKTFVLNRYVRWLKQSKIGYAVTASTGIAATHIGGMTIHSFSGIGIRKKIDARDLEELTERKYLWDRFSKTKVLLVDEISMLHADTLALVDKVCKTFKQNNEPFGGLQVIFSGDFFQLPPVDRERQTLDASQFAYNSASWTTLDPVICYITEQHRQNDPVFTEILNAIRNKSVDEGVVAKLRARMGIQNDDVGVARLFAHNEDVGRLNILELEKIDGEHFEYEMKSHGRGALVETLKKSVLAPELLGLRVGALVMCVKNNYEKGYVNGTLGTVISCDAISPTIKTRNGRIINVTPESWLVEENGKIKAEVMQVPLRLAWAITIHKSQGMSLDAAIVDLSKTFTHGMGYVALSRVRSLDGLFIEGINDMALSVHPAVSLVDEKFKNASALAETALSGLAKDEIIKRQKKFVERTGGIWVEDFEKDGVPQSISQTNIKSKIKNSTEKETMYLIEKGKSIKEVTKERGLTFGTILSHIEKALAKDKDIKINHLKPDPKTLSIIHEAFLKTKDRTLSPVKALLDKSGHKYTYEDIRIARLFLD